MVWLNSGSNVYHCPGSRYYGKTKKGSYLSESDAKAKGAHPDHNHPLHQITHVSAATIHGAIRPVHRSPGSSQHRKSPLQVVLATPESTPSVIPTPSPSESSF